VSWRRKKNQPRISHMRGQGWMGSSAAQTTHAHMTPTPQIHRWARRVGREGKEEQGWEQSMDTYHKHKQGEKRKKKKKQHAYLTNIGMVKKKKRRERERERSAHSNRSQKQLHKDGKQSHHITMAYTWESAWHTNSKGKARDSSKTNKIRKEEWGVLGEEDDRRKKKRRMNPHKPETHKRQGRGAEKEEHVERNKEEVLEWHKMWDSTKKKKTEKTASKRREEERERNRREHKRTFHSTWWAHSTLRTRATSKKQKRFHIKHMDTRIRAARVMSTHLWRSEGWMWIQCGCLSRIPIIPILWVLSAKNNVQSKVDLAHRRAHSHTGRIKLPPKSPPRVLHCIEVYCTVFLHYPLSFPRAPHAAWESLTSSIS